MLIKKSITLKKHRTSLSLEIEFCEALNKIAEIYIYLKELLLISALIKRKMFIKDEKENSYAEL